MKQAGIKYLLLSIAILTFGLWGCDSGLFDKRVSEGIIEYEVTYPNIKPDDLLSGLMPSIMTVKFKDNRYNAELSAGMGSYKTNFISNSNNYTLINSIKILSRKYATRLDKKAVEKMNEKHPVFHINKLDEKKMIAGYHCKKAMVTSTDTTMENLQVYYTDKIKISNPNWSNIYRDIDAVLLEYQIERYGILMKFTAKSVTKAALDDAEFELPSDYKNLTLTDLEKQIHSIFDAFK